MIDWIKFATFTNTNFSLDSGQQPSSLAD